MLIGQLCIWFWIDTARCRRCIDINPIKVLYLNLLQLALTTSLWVSLPQVVFTTVLRIFSHHDRIWNGSSIIRLNSAFVIVLFLLLFGISIWYCFENHAFSLHNEVVIYWSLFEALRAVQVFNSVFWESFRWLTDRDIYSSYAKGWLFEISLSGIGVSLFCATFVVLIRD